MDRRKKGGKGWEPTFFAALRQTGNIREACEAADITRANVYMRRKNDERFAASWTDAVEESADVLEREAWRRAVEGTEEEIFKDGQLVGVTRRYSDTLLIFLLKGMRPAKFRDHWVVQHEGTISVETELDSSIRSLLGIMASAGEGTPALGGPGRILEVGSGANGQRFSPPGATPSD